MKEISFVRTAATKLSADLGNWMESRTIVSDPTLADDMVSIVNNHALAAAAAGVGTTVLPGAGSVVALAGSVATLWHMYLRINERIGLKLSKVAVKSLASAVMSNIIQAGAGLLGSVAVSTVLSFTGLGVITSCAMMAAVDYAVTLAGGVIYMKLLTGLFKAGMDPEAMTDEEMKVSAEETIAGENMGELLREARDAYKTARRKGEITGSETVNMDG